MSDDETDEGAGVPPPPTTTSGTWPAAPGAPVPGPPRQEPPAEPSPASPPPASTAPTGAAAPPPAVPPAPVADAGWDRPPAPVQKKSRVGLIVGLVVGALVVVAAVVVGVVVLTGGESFPNGDQKALIRSIPGRPKAADCKAISVTDPKPIAAVSCKLDGGADVVTAAKYADIKHMNAGFTHEEKVVKLSSSSTSDCIDRDRVEHDYDSADGSAGRALCYRKGGHAVVAWTNGDTKTVFRAQRNDKQDVRLYAWWANAVKRRYPTTEQVDALKALAPAGADECQSARPLRGSVAAIRCTNADGSGLYFTQFDTNQRMNAEYLSLRSGTDLSEGENVAAATCPFEGAVTTRGALSGRVFCTYDESTPRIVYTDEPSSVLVEVIGDDHADGNALITEWRKGTYDPKA